MKDGEMILSDGMMSDENANFDMEEGANVVNIEPTLPSNVEVGEVVETVNIDETPPLNVGVGEIAETVNAEQIALFDVGVGEVEETVEITEPVTFNVEVGEVAATINTSGDPMNHALLYNRDLHNQHPIDAIEGLSDELDKIKSLKTLYSNKYNCANYYKWADGNNRNANRNNLFVSACLDQNGDIAVDICTTDKDVFGVAVSDAAFIGGQEYIKTDDDSLIGRDYSYNAIVTSGLVEVRCVSDIVVGDYVASNKDGMAIKSDGKYGYLVVDTCDIAGLPGVVIALLPSSEHAKYVAQNVDDLIQRMINAEHNIVGARNLANSAYKLSTQNQDQHEVDIIGIKEVVAEILTELKDTSEFVENTNASLTNVSINAAEAKQIANDAILSVNKTRDEAIQKANDAWAKAEEVKQKFDSLTATIAEYTVGEHSQAYGLTHSQIIKILKEGVVFVPTTDNITHEIYSQRPCLDEDGNVQYADYMERFAKNNYYVCTFNTITDNDGVEYNVMQWVQHVDGVCFSNGKLADGTVDIPLGSMAAPYWVVTESDVEVKNDDGTKTIYDLGGLYKWDGESWHKVASTTDNTLSRAVSLVSQTANEISMDITNAKGDFATFAEKISDNDVKIQTATNFLTGGYVTVEKWDDNLANETERIYYDKENGLYYYYVKDKGWQSTENSFEAGLKGNVSVIDQSSDKDGSKMALVVSGLHGDQVLNGASIVLAQDKDDSYVSIDADAINFNAKAFQILPIDDNGNAGKTPNFSVDNKGNIKLGDCAIQDGTLTIKDANIYGKISADKIYVGVSKNLLMGEQKTIDEKTKEEVFKEYKGSNEFTPTPFDLALVFDKYGLTNYTLSFEIKLESVASDENAGKVMVYCQNGNGSKYGFSNYINEVTTEWKSYSVTFTPIKQKITEKKAMLAFYGTYKTGQIVSVRKLQLQFGSTATDWEPYSDYAGKCVINSDGSIVSESGNFQVDAAGNLTAKGGGKIGGYSIGDTTLKSTDGKVGMSNSAKEGDYAFWAGNEDPANAPFNVKPNGTITATSGKIGGWGLYGNVLTNDSNGDTITGMVGVAPGIDTTDFTISDVKQSEDAQKGLCFWAGAEDKEDSKDFGGTAISEAPFRVYNDGKMFASNADIEGTIKAKEGNVGGLVIDNGIKGYVNNEQSFVLDKDGLLINNSLAKIQVGNYQTFYDDSSKSTYWQTNGPLYIQGMESNEAVTSIELLTENGVDKITPTIQVLATTTNSSYGGATIDVWLNTASALYYPFSCTVYYQLGYLRSGEYRWQEGVKTITLSVDTNSLDGNAISIKRIDEATGMWPVIRFGFSSTTLGTTIGMTNANKTSCITSAITQTRKKNNIIMKGNLIPKNDATYSLGEGGGRKWHTVYANTGEIQTSDKNEKNTINSLSDKYISIFDNLKPVSYKFNDNTSGRTHLGFIAQDVKEAIEQAGLTTQEFAGYCEWSNDEGVTGCGLRYSEFIALCVDQIQKLKTKVAELENKLSTQQSD